jgi:hypothetical protein
MKYIFIDGRIVLVSFHFSFCSVLNWWCVRMQNTLKENAQVTRVECLPVEVWLFIFSYLEAHDLFRAFTNLNNYFRQLLYSRHVLYNVQFNKDDYSSFISIIHCSSNEILNRIISLQWTAKPRYGYLPCFLNKNISKFTRLRSLKIEIHPRQTLLICKILPNLHSLEYLSIKSENIQSSLVETIFPISSLHICQLINMYAMNNIECSLIGQSNIELLYLTNISIGVHSMSESFYDHMSKLKRLEIFGSVRTLKHLSSWIVNQILIIERIPIIKIKCKSNRTTIVFFEQLQPIIFIIRRFSMHIYIDIEDEILLDNLVNNWWSFIQQIETIYISIKISKQINTSNDDIQNKFIFYRDLLFSKIDESNESCKIEWTQAECPHYKFNVQISDGE